MIGSMVRFAVDDRGVATITLDRPEVRNAFDDEMIEALTRTVSQLASEVRVVVLRGEGPVFSAGADLRWMERMSTMSPEENRRDIGRLRAMFEAIDGLRVPIVGQIQGAAIAGGVGLVACCDVAIAERATKFALTEVRLGLVPGVISPYVIRKVGYAFAREVFLTGAPFNAERAREVGLVARVVEEEDLDDAVEETVSDLLAGSPEAIAATRDLVEEMSGRSPDEVADITIDAIARARISADGKAGLRSFFEGQPAPWARD